MFQKYPNVIYGLMNEPNGISASQWATSAQAAITAIRTAETNNGAAHNIITIPGTAFTTASTWQSSGNQAAWTGYTDPVGGPIWFEMHQYLDAGNTGNMSIPTGRHCVTGKGATALNNSNATSWLTSEGKVGFIGEYDWSNLNCANRDTRDYSCALDGTCADGTGDCAIEGPNLLTSLTTSPWVGGTWWAAGGGMGNYCINLWPNGGGVPPGGTPQIQTKDLCTRLRSLGFSTSGC